jgi:glycosyltransferase involved in cell wall biosynthesis
MRVSYIIPHYEKHGILMEHLLLLNNQTYANFEVLIVDDGSSEPFNTGILSELNYKAECIRIDKNRGAAYARNTGEEMAIGDILLFVGNDTLPHPNLIAVHAHDHIFHDVDIVQGISPFHPHVMDTIFMHVLDRSGIQANWMTLRDGDKWKREANGFFLTTNVSMTRDAFHLVGGFDEAFENAAWEDIVFGMSAQQLKLKTLFNPNAINLHMHKYDLNGFVKRQLMEGRNRILACLSQPQLAGNLLSPNQIRSARKTEMSELVHRAEIELRSYEPSLDVIAGILSQCSFYGLLSKIDELGGVYQVFEHLHTGEAIFACINGVSAMNKGNKSYAEHCIGWAIQAEEGNWAIQAWAGEIYQHFLCHSDAHRAYEKSLSIDYNDWAAKKLGIK